MDQLNDGLTNMSENSGLAILLGVVLGLMMAFDMGGPLNKVAYSFAVAGLGAAATGQRQRPRAQGDGRRHAGRHGARRWPWPSRRSCARACSPSPERENGKAAWALGASFITEGAIPFAAADPRA